MWNWNAHILLWLYSAAWFVAEKNLHSSKLTQQWKMDPLKMYFLLKIVIFDCYYGRNPAPVDIGSLSPYFTRFYTSQVVGLGISSINSRLVCRRVLFLIFLFGGAKPPPSVRHFAAREVAKSKCECYWVELAGDEKETKQRKTPVVISC